MCLIFTTRFCFRRFGISIVNDSEVNIDQYEKEVVRHEYCSQQTQGQLLIRSRVGYPGLTQLKVVKT